MFSKVLAIFVISVLTSLASGHNTLLKLLLLGECDGSKSSDKVSTAGVFLNLKL